MENYKPIKAISNNNIILKKGDKGTFVEFTNDYPSLHIGQKVTVEEVYDNGVVRVDYGTSIQINVSANAIDKD